MEQLKSHMNLGLKGGCSGKALELFLSRNSESIANGQELLNYISENIPFCEDFSFETGSIGFGWLIAFLDQQELISIDVDEVLEDMDDLAYKLTVKEISCVSLNLEMLWGLIDYHTIRYRNNNQREVYYRKLVHQSCLTLLSERCTKFITNSLTNQILDQEMIKKCCKTLLKLSFMIAYFQNKIVKDSDILRYTKVIINLFKGEKCRVKKYTDELPYLIIAMRNCGYHLVERDLYRMLLSYNNSMGYKEYEKAFTKAEGKVFELTNIIENK